MKNIYQRYKAFGCGACVYKRIICLIVSSLFIFVSLGFLGGLTAFASAEKLVPVGRTVGISISSQGVIVVGVPEKCADKQTDSPGKAAGFKAGDIIVKIGSYDITSCDDLRETTKKLDGKLTAIQIIRGEKREQLNLRPAKLETGENSLGLWVRDGISGIGTVTYYNPETGAFGALGHSVSDADTGIILPVRTGAISRSSVADVQKGKTGAPGQLHGKYNFDDKIGSITSNTKSGIFGSAKGAFDDEVSKGALFETSSFRELHTGVAYILSNVTGSEVKKYAVEITRVYGGADDGRDMLITVTDPSLLEATGGIVQGMSGSPILQDGKLCGAVTHVLINDPTRGYGISIERMLDSAASAA